MSEKMEARSSLHHYLIAVLLGVAGLFILLIFVSLRSQADDSSSSATVSNQAPSIDTVTVNSLSSGAGLTTFTLTENTTTTLYVYGTFTDNNGCSEVSGSGSAVVTPAISIIGQTCSASTDNNEKTCYLMGGNPATRWYADNCTLSNCSGGTDVSGSFLCSFNVWHFASSTNNYSADWVASVNASDGSLTSSQNSATTFDINSLTAINVTANIDYGSLALGATSTVKTITITNTGNDLTTDVTLYGTAMNCTVGTIAVGQQAYTSSTSASPATALSTASTSVGLSMRKQTVSTTAVTSNTRWMLTLPSSGLSGTCTGTISFLAT